MDIFSTLKIHSGLSYPETCEVAKKQFRILAKELHPDTSSDPDAAEKFRLLKQAYEIVKDPISFREAIEKSNVVDNPREFLRDFLSQRRFNVCID